MAGAADPEIVNVPVTVPFHFQYEDTIGERNLPVVESVEARISSMAPYVKMPTQVAAPGGPGPGLTGSAIGGRISGLADLRNPSVAGREIVEYSTDELPNSQQPGDPGISLVVKT